MAAAIHGGIPAWVNFGFGLTASAVAAVAVLAELVSIASLRALASYNKISQSAYRSWVEKVVIVGMVVSGAATYFGVWAIVWAAFQSQYAAALLAFLAGIVVLIPQAISIPSLRESVPQAQRRS